MVALNANLVVLCPAVDAALVKEIIDTDLSDARVNNFINMAYYITIPLQGALDACGGADAVCQILQLLAAHFLTLYERTTKSENVAGEWSVSYMAKEGIALEASLYGQQAIALDCSGKLKSAGLRVARFRILTYYDFDPDWIDPE